MKYTLCGIEISEEHASAINASIARIEESLRRDEALHFRNEYAASRNNPHSTFRGTCEEYIKKYLPLKIGYLKYY